MLPPPRARLFAFKLQQLTQQIVLLISSFLISASK